MGVWSVEYGGLELRVWGVGYGLESYEDSVL